MKKLNLMAALLLTVATLFSAAGAPHRPCLLLTQDGVAALRAEMGKNPLVDKAFVEAKAVADKAVSEPVVVPQPLDVGGGYSHEKHKENYMQMYQAGVVYQLTGEKKYAEFVRRMLLDYAEIYPDLPLHPARFTTTPGKIFYQVLNEAVWLTFTANAYDCVYDHIPAAERERIETRLFRPMVEFMENGVPDNYRAFNSMHNFGTWMAAGTGMIGYVMGDRDLVDKALKGSTKEGKTGFLAQLDALFSPDGYYDEGPGYQRYAIYPFVTLAECIDHNDPGIGIFRYRDGILQKSVNSLLQCTYEGDIFLMNDAIAKDIHTYEILFSADIAYKASPRDKGLLGIVERQGVVTLTDAGAAAARAIARGEARPFDYRSTVIRSGPDGCDGGLGIIRSAANNTCLTLKATTHGGGHGHFDRLSMIYFANGTPVIPDYGSARFINVVAKARGGYAPENRSFAQLSIAHNTVTIDSTTHFSGSSREAQKQGARILFSDFSDRSFQIVSAMDDKAYKGVTMRRSVALIEHGSLEYPVVLDIFRLLADKPHVYDLPYYYNGHLMSTSYPYDKQVDRLTPMGTRYGYQHLWREAVGHPEGDFTQLCWLENGRFYTLSAVSSTPCTPYLVKTGANDPDYNLITRNGVLFRTAEPTAAQTFVSVIEPHGNYDLVTETTRTAESQIERVELLAADENTVLVRISILGGGQFTVALGDDGSAADARHALDAQGRTYRWKGTHKIFDK